MQEGDLTVPLLSLGAMCRGGWRTQRLNPANIPVVTRVSEWVNGLIHTHMPHYETAKND